MKICFTKKSFDAPENFIHSNILGTFNILEQLRKYKKAVNKKIKLNITAVYTFEQTKKIYKKLNKKTKSIISIFAGRMSDKGKDPVPIFKKSISLVKKNKNIEILWASTREAYNYTQAKQLNCNIITMPPKIINQINKFGKSFSEMTIDTVKGFLQDSKKSKFKI